MAAAEIMGTPITCATAELSSSKFSALIDFESDSFHRERFSFTRENSCVLTIVAS